MERRGRSTPKTSKHGSSICTLESIGERTERNHPNERGFPSSTASCDPWGLQHWRTRSSNRRYGWCWNAFTKRTFWVSVTAFVLDEAVTELWMHSPWAYQRRK